MSLIREIDFRQELKRSRSQTAKLLYLFKKYGELTTTDLQRVGTGCSSRVNELRKEGHAIVAVYEKPGMWRYVYLGAKDDVHDTL